MSPTIKDGTKLECEFKDDKYEYSIGEIVFFKDQETNEYTIHRIISLAPLITKGDRSYQIEQPQQILGLVIINEKLINLKVLFSKIMLMKKPFRYLGTLGLRIIS